jgi:3',5'-cyclic AMP phosphodiesterase CpdA
MVLIFLSGCQSKYVEKDPLIINKTGAKNEVHFIVASDLHVLAESIFDRGEAFEAFSSTSNGVVIPLSEQLFKLFALEVIEKRPDFLVITGDLTVNGERASHMVIADTLSEIEQAGIAVYVIPGNHDINNPWARAFEGGAQIITPSVTEKDFAEIYKNFGYNTAERAPNDLSYYLPLNDKIGMYFIDTNNYKNNKSLGYPVAGSFVEEDTISWLEAIREVHKDEGALIFMHHNLLNHSSMFQEGYVSDKASKLKAIFSKDHLAFASSGHLHIQDVTREEKAFEVVNYALGVYPHLYGEYTLEGDVLTYTVSQLNVFKMAEKTNWADDALKDYDTFGPDFYKSVNRRMIKRFRDQLEIDETEATILFETFLAINQNFTNGKEAESQAYLATDAYMTLTQSDGFMSKYLLTIVADNPVDDHNFKLNLKTGELLSPSN